MPVQTHLPTEILDYIETHAPSDSSVNGISQQELARVLGYHPCSMSRPLAELVSDGFVRKARGPVRGGQRKQFIYRLTQEGREKLRKAVREVPILSGGLPPPPNPFFGRKEELRTLESYSVEGGSIILIEGPSGMGKSALVARHLRRLRNDRVPFWFCVRGASSPRHFATALAHALSPLGAQQLAYYSQLPRAPVGREVADLAGRALDHRPLAAVIDDAQFASEDMRSFLSDFVSGMLRGRPDLFFILSQRPERGFGPPERTFKLDLGGLDRAAAHELSDRRGGLAKRFHTVYESTSGSPLLLQLAASHPNVEASFTALPAAVVDQLSVRELAALLPVALASEALPISFVEEEGHLSKERIGELTRMGILQRTLEERTELLQVVRPALISRVTPGDERQAHLVLASFYGRSHHGDAIRERFLHLVSAESWRTATQLLTRQDRALLSLGYSEALRIALRRLILAMPRGGGRLRALRVESTLLRAHSDYSESILSLRRAIAESEGDPRLVGECLLQIVELYLRLRQTEEADRAFDEARTIGPISRRLQAFLILTEARIAEGHGDLATAHTLYHDAFETSRHSRIADLALEGAAAWSRLSYMSSGPEAALKTVEEALPQARKSGRMDIVFNLLLVRARSFLDAGKKEAADREMRLIRDEAESLGYLNQLTYVLSGLAAVSVERERWEEAVTYSKQAISLSERLGNDLVLGNTLATLSTSQFRQAFSSGNAEMLEEARVQGERSIEVLRRIPPTDSLAFAHGYLCEIYLHAGVHDKASEHYGKAVEVADQLGLVWVKERLLEEFSAKIPLPGTEPALSRPPPRESRPGGTPPRDRDAVTAALAAGGGSSEGTSASHLKTYVGN